jgi:hypothetical protein
MKTRIVIILITLLCTAMANLQSARTATILVTNTNDSGPGSLRQALADANDGDTIDATGVSGTILLTSGELQIFTPGVTIKGSGAATLAVNGNGSSRVFENFARDVTISGFTITNGVSDGGGGISNHLSGICCATLTVTNSTISGNSADYGGGISNAGLASVLVINSTISGNSANYGGGISNVSGDPGASSVMISNSTLSGNLASVDGGGVYNSGSHVDPAGLSIENSTVSGNSATGNGGGIYHSGSGPFGSATFHIGSTILNAGASGGTIFNAGTATSLGYNLASDAGGGVLTGAGDQINTNPLLGPLQDNGGQTFTHALLPGSPAIDAGDPSFTPPPSYDQRGCPFVRAFNGRIDVGSLEVQPPPLRPCPTPRPRPTPHPRPTV